jgi:16S rRNA (guanine527-N7)-methyltransferase
MAMTHMAFPTGLWQQSLGWQPTADQQARFVQLYGQICAGNQHLNLTRITDPQGFWEKHLWDSLSGIGPWLLPMPPAWARGDVCQVIDIGTGGGFPGIPVAIAMPTWSITLLDSTRKKVQFLKTLCQALELNQITCLTDRAETLGHHPEHRNQYDLALVRAVGSPSTCAEYALPLLKPTGMAILYRGQWNESETIALTPALQQLGGTLREIRTYQTPITQGTRHCLYIQKTAPTARQFPRKVGVPAKTPL